MSETKTVAEKTIRKIRKKLRQIEHLELLDRELNDEELSKVIIKGSLRKELRQLLEEYYPEEAAAMKRSGSYLPVKREVKKARSPTVDENKEVIDVKDTTADESKEVIEVKDNSDTNVNSNSGDQISVPAQKDHQHIAVDHVENKDLSWNVVATKRSPIHKETTTTSISNDTGLEKSEHKVTQISLPKTKEIEIEKKCKTDGKKNQISLPKTKEMEIEKKCKTDVKKVTKKDVNPQKSIKSIWKDSEYHIYNMEGHNDLVISVDCTEEYIISGSRDTMIKVWKVGESNEERTLRGHKSPVTGVAILPETLAAKTLTSLEEKIDSSSASIGSCAILAVSVGLDCTLNLWDIVSGENHGSHYTYNGMTALGCGSWGVVVGTEGGKLEVWCLSSGQRLAVCSAFQSQVSTITVVGEDIFVGSMEGEVGVWRFDKQNNSLVSQYLMNPESSTFIPLRNHSAMCAYKGVMYLGDTGPNIKTLDWKNGTSNKLKNHLGSMGMTDSITVHESGHLLSSSYHMDSGYPSVNVRDLSNGSYICSLLDNDEGRYLTMASATNILVTGGHLLKVWKRLHKGSKTSATDDNIEIIIPSWLPSLSQCAEDSSDDETDWASSSEDEEVRTYKDSKRRTSDTSISNGSSQGSWCVIM